MSSEKSLVRCLYFVAASLVIQNYIALAKVKQFSITQCAKYKSFGKSSRNVNSRLSGGRALCDNTLAPVGWYRFIGYAGNRMPSSYVTSGKCRTNTPGWVRGNHPRGKFVTIGAEVCFDIHKNRTCGTSKSILITNCGRYFVYRLSRITHCSKMYCGAHGDRPITFPPTLAPTTKFSEAVNSGPKSCPEEEKEGITWPSTKAGNTSTQPCPNGKGLVTRTCSHSGWKDVNGTNCIYLAMKALNKQVGYLSNPNITHAERSKAAENIINKLSNITDLDNVEPQGGEKRLNERDLVSSVKILHDIIKLNISNTSLNFIQPASNILDLRNKRTWNGMKNSIEVLGDLVVSLEDYGFHLSGNLEDNKTESTVVQKASYLELHAKMVEPRSYSSSHYTHFQFPNSAFSLTPNVFATQGNTTALVVVVYYRTLHSILTQGKLRLKQTNLKMMQTEHKINRQIITASVRPKPLQEFQKPVRIKWKKKSTDKDSLCVFLKPELNEKMWSTNGCQIIEGRDDDDHLTCECNHLTAFASMDISEEMVTPRERQSLEIISTIGCSLSLLGVVLTIFSYYVFWSKLHSKTKTEVPSRVLMNICIAVGMTDILAIVAGPAQSNKTFCTVVSVLLFLSVLSVFGWMLCEGIVVYIQLVRIFSGLGGKYLRVFYIIGWGIPVIVVTLSVGLIDTKEFTTKHACWFQAGGPLLWIFIGTAGLTLLINIGVFILALKKMFASHKISNGSRLKKAKAGLKATAVLLPLLGLTWLFGLIVFNRDLIVFKYLFAIFNSLQGLMIFFFHVLVNKQIHEAIYRKRNMRRARAATAISILPSKKKRRVLSSSPDVLPKCSRTRPRTESLQQTPTVWYMHPKRTKFSTPIVFINITDNNECKNSNNGSNNSESFDNLSLVDL